MEYTVDDYADTDYGAETNADSAYSPSAPQFDHNGMMAGAEAAQDAFEKHEAGRLATKPAMPAHGLTPQQCGEAMKSVYLRMFQHIFDKCGFMPAAPKGFDTQLVYAVLEPIRIDDIPGAASIIKFMDSRDHAGRPKQRMMPLMITPQGSFVKGDVWDYKKDGNPTMLPGYNLEVLGADGKLHKRTILPQNPNTNSGTAGLARNGHQILHIMNGDAHYDDKSRKFMMRLQRAPGASQIEVIVKGRRG